MDASVSGTTKEYYTPKRSHVMTPNEREKRGVLVRNKHNDLVLKKGRSNNKRLTIKAGTEAVLQIASAKEWQDMWQDIATEWPRALQVGLPTVYSSPARWTEAAQAGTETSSQAGPPFSA
ncbi:uncharacterized protein CCR75_009044 [Bremia lactucae]|uniref:Uncharacterized protein n=1 Tax=Bremia lactucae TaxID=4779 RepID=A0A976IB05_BRELC|nr:hypothetical protein CCR75_009044 [Bremia lactucae]